MGISLRGLRDLKTRLTKLCVSKESPFREEKELIKGRVCPAAHSFEDLTTTQLVHLWVKEQSVTGSSRLAEVADLIDPADIGPPAYFISHACRNAALNAALYAALKCCSVCRAEHGLEAFRLH
jgi:hypothetical protein